MPSAPASATSLAMRRTRSSSTPPSIVQPKEVARPQLILTDLPLSRHSCDDAAEILDQLAGAAPDIGQIVALADRQHEIHLVHPEREAALGAARVGDQRRHGEPRQGQRMPHHRLGIGQLRQQLRRHEGATPRSRAPRRRIRRRARRAWSRSAGCRRCSAARRASRLRGSEPCRPSLSSAHLREAKPKRCTLPRQLPAVAPSLRGAQRRSNLGEAERPGRRLLCGGLSRRPDGRTRGPQ